MQGPPCLPFHLPGTRFSGVFKGLVPLQGIHPDTSPEADPTLSLLPPFSMHFLILRTFFLI